MSNWDGIEVGLIIAFCFMVLLIITLLVVAQWEFLKCVLCRAINGSNYTANWVEGQFENDDSHPNYYYHSTQGSDMELLSMMNSLPVSQFNRNESKGMPINADCAICLGEFDDEEWLRILPNCNHGFHVSCIDRWLRSHSNCPLCRSHVIGDSNTREGLVSFNTWLDILGMEDISFERSDAHFPSHSL